MQRASTKILLARRRLFHSLHHYGENDPRWLDAENGARQIALAHVGVLRDYYDGVAGELKRSTPRHPRPGAKRRR
jgi:hypothetical protein